MGYRLQKLEEHQRADHYYLEPDDACYYFGEYTAGGGWSCGKINQLIFNFKDRRAAPQYRQGAIRQVGAFLSVIAPASDWSIIPIPPSKAIGDPNYDGRLVEALGVAKRTNAEIDYKEVITQRVSTEASHASNDRAKPADLSANYDINAELLDSCRPQIIIFDDMLTAGAHFRASSDLIKQARPDVSVVGLFVARRITDPASIFGD